jgi:2-polyprenyl-3-methyl-5-hydroxy-6-metoxy-1,4-benzoquinol methylase
VSQKEFEKWYFEDWHAYHRKRKAIRMLYYDVLSWANSFVSFDLLYGEGRRALDVGCAHGYVVELLASLGYDAYGCDVSQLYLCSYAKKVANNLVLCDAQKLPFHRKSFNVITSFEVLEHLRNHVEFLRNCFRSLGPEGVLVLQTPRGIPTIDAVFSKLYGRTVFKTSDVEHHINTLVNKSDLNDLLEYCGFESHVETFFLLPLNPTLFNRYFPTRIPVAVPTFRAVAVKQ